jgi:hypothetical protein
VYPHEKELGDTKTLRARNDWWGAYCYFMRSVGLFTDFEVLIQETVKILFPTILPCYPLLVSCASELIAVKVNSACYWLCTCSLKVSL